ncbi:MAG TPA: YfhO family protein, partial [Planctomycetota bacterium]|nr:YfhO family protein [Planctomycetota bacterium]
AGHLYGGHVNHVWAYPWMAAVLGALEAFLSGPTLRRGVWLGAAAALILLAGVPQYFVFALGLVALWLLHFVLERKEERHDRVKLALKAGAWLGWSVALCAAQILPTLELAGESQRSASERPEFFTQYSLPPENLLTLFAPAFFGDAVRSPYWGRWYLWEVCGYVGVTTLLLAGLALGGTHRQRYFWLGVAAGSLLLAFGRYGFLPAGTDLFRAPGRFLLLFTLAFAALAGIGIDRFRRETTKTGYNLTGVCSLAILGIIFMMVVRVRLTPERWTGLLEWMKKLPDGSPTAGASLEATRSSLLVAALLLGASVPVLILLIVKPEKEHWARALFAGLVLVDVLGFSHRFFRRQPEKALYWPPALVSVLKERTGTDFRVGSFGGAPRPVAGNCQAAGIDSLLGYEPLLLRRYAEVVNRLENGDPATPFVELDSLAPTESLDFLAPRLWLIWDDVRIQEQGWRKLGTAGTGTIYENPHAFPRAWVVDHAVVLEAPLDRLQALARLRYDLRKTVILERMPDDAPPTPSDAPGRARLVSRGPGRYEIEAENKGEAYLVLSEAYYPGWSAEVDGRAADVLPADHLIQAVRLPPGKHTVHFRYRSRFLAPGLTATLLALLLPAGMALRRRLRPAAP